MCRFQVSFHKSMTICLWCVDHSLKQYCAIMLHKHAVEHDGKVSSASLGSLLYISVFEDRDFSLIVYICNQYLPIVSSRSFLDG